MLLSRSVTPMVTETSLGSICAAPFEDLHLDERSPWKSTPPPAARLRSAVQRLSRGLIDGDRERSACRALVVRAAGDEHPKDLGAGDGEPPRDRVRRSAAHERGLHVVEAVAASLPTLQA